MLVIAFLSLFVSIAVAFVPTKSNLFQVIHKANLRMASPFSNEIGAQAPIGFFDPLGFLKDADQDRFERLRKVEIKHGRISMLAILGHITTTAGVHLPGK